MSESGHICTVGHVDHIEPLEGQLSRSREHCKCGRWRIAFILDNWMSGHGGWSPGLQSPSEPRR